MTDKQRQAFVALLWAADNLLLNMDDMEESKNDDGEDWDDVAELRATIKRVKKSMEAK